MVGGYTDFDAVDVALRKILDEWRRMDTDYITRVKHLRGKLPGGLNGAFFLDANTVHDNSVRDDLFGCTGQNWYLAHTTGAVEHLRAPERECFGRALYDEQEVRQAAQ